MASSIAAGLFSCYPMKLITIIEPSLYLPSPHFKKYMCPINLELRKENLPQQRGMCGHSWSAQTGINH